MRVKGRFVKRSVEQAKDDGSPATTTTTTTNTQNQEQQLQQQDLSGTSSTSSDNDVDMPDVNDPEAGFKPTVKQPYRRARRHTIT